jgi:hypothetical protein
VGADLRRAWLFDASLRGALYDVDTRWPEGFDPRTRGAILCHSTIVSGRSPE